MMIAMVSLRLSLEEKANGSERYICGWTWISRRKWKCRCSVVLTDSEGYRPTGILFFGEKMRALEAGLT